MSDFIYYDFETSRGGRGKRMSANEAKVHLSKVNRGMSINQEVSGKLHEKGLLKLRLREDPYTGQLVLIFNADKGRQGIVSKSRNVGLNLLFNSIDLAKLLVQRLKLNDNNNDKSWIVNIKLIGESDHFAAYEVSRTSPDEEYKMFDKK